MRAWSSHSEQFLKPGMRKNVMGASGEEYSAGTEHTGILPPSHSYLRHRGSVRMGAACRMVNQRGSWIPNTYTYISVCVGTSHIFLISWERYKPMSCLNHCILMFLLQTAGFNPGKAKLWVFRWRSQKEWERDKNQGRSRMLAWVPSGWLVVPFTKMCIERKSGLGEERGICFETLKVQNLWIPWLWSFEGSGGKC